MTSRNDAAGKVGDAAAKVGDAAGQARDAVHTAADHPLIETGARIGYVANALMHVGIAYLAIRLALGYRHEHADQSGALGLILDHRGGVAILVIGIVGWALLGLWQLGEACLPWAKPAERTKATAKVVVYLALAWTCLEFARSHRTSSSAQSTGFARDVIDKPGGRLLLAIGGLVIVGVGAYHVVKGVRRRFLRDLREDPGDFAELAGVLGYAAKGLALAIAGILVVVAGAKGTPADARGLDGAFRTVLDLPFGPGLVALIGIGFAAYAVYSLARARFARV